VVREHLINTGRSFIFDTGLCPGAAGAALKAVEIIAAEPELAGLALARAAQLAAAAGVPATDSAVVPVPIGDAQRAYDLSLAMRDRERIQVKVFHYNFLINWNFY
jgi:8-amino-7-oxononanoate synthase